MALQLMELRCRIKTLDCEQVLELVCQTLPMEVSHGQHIVKWVHCKLYALGVQDPSKTFLTTTNVNQGTAMYMAPEQFNGTRLDEK